MTNWESCNLLVWTGLNELAGVKTAPIIDEEKLKIKQIYSSNSSNSFSSLTSIHGISKISAKSTDLRAC